MDFRKLLTEKVTIRIIVVGMIIIPLILITFSWRRLFFDFDQPISEEAFGTFGDFIGGVVGSLWSLAGIILFYLALKEQRKDLKLNRKALNKQIKALEIQTDEFQQQKVELELTRKIFKEQSRTLKKQQFESTFFSMINIYVQITDALTESREKNFFVRLSKEMSNSYVTGSDHWDSHKKAISTYYSLYYKYKDDISHYYRTIFRLFKFIDESSLDKGDKLTYSKFVRSQFTEKELFILYYNAHTDFGVKFYNYILKYDLLKHLPAISKVEFKEFIVDDNEKSVNLLNLCSSIQEFGKQFEVDFEEFEKQKIEEVVDEELESTIEKFQKSFKHVETGLIVQFESKELVEIEIMITSIDSSKTEITFGYDNDQLILFFEKWLYDKYCFSKFLPEESKFEVLRNTSENEVKYLIRCGKNLTLR